MSTFRDTGQKIKKKSSVTKFDVTLRFPDMETAQ